MAVRRILVAVIAVLVAAQIVRQGMVDSFAALRPETAAAVWPGHPDVRIAQGMTSIAAATRARQPIPDAVLAGIAKTAAKAPLAPEPYLVRGIQAQLGGDVASALRAFAAARSRDPQSLPARYFLADLYLRQGNAAAGLREIAVLARLAPNGVASLAPYVATFASQRATWPQLRALFRAEPLLEQATMQALAADAANAEAVLALSTRKSAGVIWLPQLIDNLVRVGRYAEARRVWMAVSGARPGTALLFDPTFSDGTAPPPFNWSLTSSGVGLAERQRGGGLHVIYHGREDGVLAAQLTLLRPGRYRLAAPASGSGARSAGLRWRIWCVSTNSEIALRALKDMGAKGFVFDIAGNCPAQRVELVGSAADMPQPSDVIVREVRLTRDGADG
ncbi:tetratricopeptide repeat protein [Sphingomonas lutea]|uniref:Tetratricopeptide repeat protein n=1 Tax=Sphingomonas lutea TaxID=1045317 RepID=A0A7G9SG56_9SPHN|nr:tetratricopeptide repeat protein [Sphingomonas lutea]QNN66831.1 tetratricopeptide repeat protein [Sphingomonas lutea]